MTEFAGRPHSQQGFAGLPEDHQPSNRIDKSLWGEGPWQHEPDRAEWEHAGLPCLAIRHPHSGHWCGYAAVPPQHPYHGRGQEEVDVDVHGGLTYAKACHADVCHVPKPGEPDNVWWFGFDCAHAGDLACIMLYQLKAGTGYPWPEKPYDHAVALAADDYRVDCYRTLDYVVVQTNYLAEQLREARQESQ